MKERSWILLCFIFCSLSFYGKTSCAEQITREQAARESVDRIKFFSVLTSKATQQRKKLKLLGDDYYNLEQEGALLEESIREKLEIDGKVGEVFAGMLRDLNYCINQNIEAADPSGYGVTKKELKQFLKRIVIELMGCYYFWFEWLETELPERVSGWEQVDFESVDSSQLKKINKRLLKQIDTLLGRLENLYAMRDTCANEIDVDGEDEFSGFYLRSPSAGGFNPLVSCFDIEQMIDEVLQELDYCAVQIWHCMFERQRRAREKKG